MHRNRTSKRKAVGLAPGTIQYTGIDHDAATMVSVVDYSADHLQENALPLDADLSPYRDPSSNTWIRVIGLQNTDFVSSLGGTFGLHPLLLEDVVNTGHRPKMEEIGDNVFVILKTIDVGDDRRIQPTQVSLVIGRGYVISFHERDTPAMEPVLERIRHGKGRIRKMGADYLAYAIMDAIVDNYFVVLDQFADWIDVAEETVTSSSNEDVLGDIHRIRRQVVRLRKGAAPLREVVSGLSQADSELISDDIDVFLRDLYDHIIQVTDMIDTFRDMLSGVQDVYLANVSNRMNEVMKVLTMIATIFVPLTFLAGIYGMNFEFIPELRWPLGYLFFWCVSAAMGVTMVLYFRRKKWL